MRTTSTETPGDLSPKQHVRVHTFGCFQIEWLDPQTGQVTPLPSERLPGQHGGSGLGLLKALLSCPDRFATRSWLNELFWPNSRQRSAEERLNDVVSSLRTLLRPKGSTEMLVHFVYGTSGRGAGFRLDAYPQLWCDADAFEWHVKHALLLDQRGQDATACWEHAYGLAERGMYLSEQIEEDWSRPRRDYLTGLVRDCVHRWIQLLRQMGHVDEAIARLRSYLLEHPTDQDALRPMLGMLGEPDTEPWERLLAAQKNPSEVISSPILDKFERLICEAWELSNMNEWDAAKGVLASFLPRIITISQQRTHPKAAELASQGLRLQSIIIHHHLSLPEKVLICQQSVEHARLAQNPDTLIAAWLELAVAYKYDGQLDKWFRIMQEALFYAPQASPLLQSQA